MQDLKASKYFSLKKCILLQYIILASVLLISCKDNKLPDFVTGLNDTLGKSNSENPKMLKKVRFLPNWTLNSQFSAYYVGQKLGIFKKHGIDLEILTYNPSNDYISFLRNAEADFVLLWLSDALEAIDKNVDLVNIVQFSEKSSVLFVSKKESGINELKDFNYKKIAVWQDFIPQTISFFHKNKISVEIIPVTNSLSLFYCNGVDAIAVNYFDEFHTILNAGYDNSNLNLFFMSDYGFNLLEDGIYCNRKLFNSNPELCVEFVDATIESWNYVFSHKNEAIDIIEEVMKKNNLPFNKAHQNWMLDRYKENYLVNGKINTFLSEEDYNNNCKVLLGEKMIKSTILYNDFYKGNKIYNLKNVVK